MKHFIVTFYLLTTACTSFGDVTFNKQDKEPSYNKFGMNWERELDNKNRDDLPKPNLILERGLVYTPSTRIQTRIYSGSNKPHGMRLVPESEYWKGN